MKLKGAAHFALRCPEARKVNHEETKGAKIFFVPSSFSSFLRG
jgi:hypothetical protein